MKQRLPYVLLILIPLGILIYLFFGSDEKQPGYQSVPLGNGLLVPVAELLARTGRSGSDTSWLYENEDENLFVRTWTEPDTLSVEFPVRYRHIADKFVSNTGNGVLANYGPLNLPGIDALSGEIRTRGEYESFYLLTLIREGGQCYIIISGTLEKMRSRHGDVIRKMCREIRRAS